MKRKLNIKEIVIIVLCITIIVLGIGFSTLSMKLDKYKDNSESFDLNFTNIKLLSSIKSGEKDPKGDFKIDKSGNILLMDFYLFNEYDEISYEVTIKNDGTIPASIIGLLSSPDFKTAKVLTEIAPINISISELSGKILEPGEETKVKITAQYLPGAKKSEEKSVEGSLAIIAETKK